MRIFCGGIHCAGCKPFGALIPLSILILCITIRDNTPIILRGLMTAIEWGCGILAVGMVLTALIFAGLMRWLRPTMFVRVEALNAYDNNHSGQKEIDRRRRAVVRPPNVVAVLPRTAYEWQENGQQLILSRR